MPYKEPQPGEEIVISGISGVYPQCENISVLAQKLFAREDLITDLPHLNFSAGKLKSVKKFDAVFFGITNEHAEYMDPLCRILLEKTYEAISDAGYSYLDFKNTNTAVYVANCTSDAEVESTFRTDVKGALICERAQSFLANRISYWLGCHGPSSTVNTACSSSLYALEFAYEAIRRGECEASIVGGSNLCMAPGMVRLYKNLGITSSRCRSFDDKAIGFCRSEAISAILLQKAKHARRIYAEVVHVKTNNDGYKKQSILFPSHLIQSRLINEVYEECDVPKQHVSWVEAHGTGTRVGDYQEMKSLQTLCEGRTSPLLVGCVKSNLGHTEATSGLCAIAKVIIAMETGFVPPNLHFTSPQNGIEALLTDQIQIITKKTAWNGGFVAINNFGIGGSNAHLLLKWNNREKHFYENDNIPRLITISGRTVESVESIIEYLHSTPMNIELIALLHKVFNKPIPTHVFRAYAIVNDENSSVVKQWQYVKTQKRPVWFIYPGMGTQWIAMGEELMRLQVFKKSIMECHNILKPFGLNLVQIVATNDPNTFENIVHCFVGIAAIMIALTDLLRSIELEPDGYIGHSFGEIVCGYADHCLSKRQALLAAYYRGLATTQTSTIRGLMAVIGLNGEAVKERCPNAVEVACYNGLKCCTIAGPEIAVRKLITEFKKEAVFANEIFSDNIAYHSSYIQTAGLVYEDYLHELIPTPKRRSSKWLSTSTEENQWTTSLATHCSAKYFSNNLLHPVLMEGCLKHIPNNAITIEIAPHSIFKTVLNESLNESVVNVSLMNKHHSKALQNFFTSLGTLYNLGVNFDASKLYEPITFPVSRGTPMISPLIKWNHEKDWYVPFENFEPTFNKNKHSVTVSYENEESSFLRGCIIDGRNVYPESGYLKMVWKAFAEKQKMSFQEISVKFSDVNFHKHVEIPQNGRLDFDVIITRNGHFEVTLIDELVVDGHITVLQCKDDITEILSATTDLTALQTDDVYHDLRIKGYHYENQFQMIVSSNLDGSGGRVRRTRNWILYLNSLIQFFYFTLSSPSLHLVSHIDTIKINPIIQSKIEIESQEVRITSTYIESAGVKIGNAKAKYQKRNPVKMPMLQTIEFTSYRSEKILPIEKVIRAITTIVLENCLTSRLNVMEFIDSVDGSQILSTYIDDYFGLLPFYKIDITLNAKNADKNVSRIRQHYKIIKDMTTNRNTHLLIMPEPIDEINALKNVACLTENGFLLMRHRTRRNEIQIQGFHQFAINEQNNETLTLWHKSSKRDNYQTIRINHENFDWIRQLQSLLEESDSKIILYSDSYESGIIGFFNCLRKENRGDDLRCFLILDPSVLPFDLNNEFYSNQLNYGLAVNVYQNRQWGCYVPHLLEPGHVLSQRIYLAQNSANDEFYWVEDKSEPETNQLIHPTFLSLRNHFSQRLINFAENVMSQAKILSYEFSGLDNLGTEVMGISFSKKIYSPIDKKDCIYWRVEKNVTSKQAVILPLPYIVALNAFLCNHHPKYRTVLIQNAYSVYGQAMITAALFNKYAIYSVENNVEESQYIITHNPEVMKSFYPEQLINSNEFQVEISKCGIDLLILSRYHHYTHELLTLLNDEGKVIFIGNENTKIGMLMDNILRLNLQFQVINPLRLLGDRNAITSVSEQFQEILRNGYVKPFYPNITGTNTNDDLEHPLVLQLPQVGNMHDNMMVYKAKSNFTCSSHESIIICGGLGGMGFELALWLASRGARKIILVSRTGFCSGYKLKSISRLKKIGVEVIISTDNIATMEGVTHLLETANNLGPVIGIFNTTLILQDNAFENQTKQSFQLVADPKATATIIMDKLSREMCPKLKYFVVFSSITCGYGNAGQTNYGYANSVMERICEKRANEGLPALAIEWAGVLDAGYLQNVKKDQIPSGTELQSIRSCWDVLDEYLHHRCSVVTSFIATEEEVSDTIPSTSIFKTIRKIIDKGEMEVSEETTLENIGLDSIAVAEIKNILEQHCNIFMSVKDILMLRVQKLWDMEKKYTTTSSEELTATKKLSILEEVYANFFEIMAKEKEILSVKPIIRLPSFLQNGATIEESVTKERTIFFLPSIEGLAEVMQPLARNIDFQVLCAQYNIRTTSIRQIVQILLPEIERRLTSTKPFHILGYSYGGLLAMEIAHALENKGRNGYLYIIDSSPSIVKWISKTLYRDQSFYTNTMAFVRALRPVINMKKFDHGLRQQKNWESVRAYINESLPNNLTHTKEFLDMTLNTLYERINDVDLYNGIPKRSLISKVFFFKPREQIFHPSPPSDLMKFCNNPIQEFDIDGNHFTILKSEILAYYIMNLHKN